MTATTTDRVHRTQAHAADSPMVAPLLVTVPQAARILAIGRTALYQLIWDGELTPIHIGRSVRLSLEQLRSFVDRRSTG